MTTAHRATWKAARGGLGEEGSFSLHAPSTAVAARDLAGQTALKNRSRVSTRSSAEIRRELDEQERAAKRARTVAAAMLPLRAPADYAAMLPRPNPEFSSLDADVEIGFGSDGGIETTWSNGKDLQASEIPFSRTKWSPRGEGAEGNRVLNTESLDGRDENGVVRTHPHESRDTLVKGNQEVDTSTEKDLGITEDITERSNDREVVDDDDDDYDDDDEEELRAELMRIRAEREKEREAAGAAEAEQIAAGNPLLNLSAHAASIVDDTDGESVRSAAPSEFTVRRRWDDDVVFKNQARNERALAPRFINDTIRNDFHRRFMKRYVR